MCNERKHTSVYSTQHGYLKLTYTTVGIHNKRVFKQDRLYATV